jgi:hypothetical protein
VSPGDDTWLINNGASKHMTSQRGILSSLTEKKFPQKVTLEDDYQYPMKGVGESTYKLDSWTPMKMKDVLYVAGISKNIVFILALDKKSFRVEFKMVKFLCGLKEKP